MLYPLYAIAKRRDDAESIRLLLLSGSRYRDTGFLEHAKSELADFLPASQNVVFIPYANPSGMGYQTYTEKIRAALEPLGYRITSPHEVMNKRQLIENADAIFVGGGNTFELLDQLYDRKLLRPVQETVRGGTPYIGVSAGTNIACVDIRTTNDMPIVWPHSLDALQLLPFNINPHFPHEDKPAAPNQETRTARLNEFLARNQNARVLALEEGCMVRREGRDLKLRGVSSALLFTYNKPPIRYEPGADLSFLL
jgi:dipeptidase E